MPVKFEVSTVDDEPSTVFSDREKNGTGSRTLRRQSCHYRSTEENLMAVLLKAFIFFQFITSHGLGTFVNVYLVVINDWSSLKAAWILFTKHICCLLFQTFFGAYVDQTKNKKLLLFVLAATKIVSGIILITSTNFELFIFKGVLDGIHKSLLIPVVTAMTLGAVGKTRFHRKHAAVNLMIRSVAVAFGSILVGGIAYAIYPNVKYVFALFIAAGIGSIMCVLAMPKEEDAINSHVARGKSIRIMTKLLIEDDDESDSDDEFKEEEPTRKELESAKTDDPKGAYEANMRQKARDSMVQGGRNEEIEITPQMTIFEMFSDPSRRMSLLFLFLVFFSFHLVNATTLPLLGQYLGKEKNHRDALPIMTGLTLMEAAGAFFNNWYLRRNLRKVEYRTVLLFGCGMLTLRVILISILVNFTNNLWAIGCTNLLDGLGHGSLDLMLALYSHALSRQTGHYNLNMGIIGTGSDIGGALGMLLGGLLSDYFSYGTAFTVLASLMVFPICFCFAISNPSLYGQVK